MYKYIAITLTILVLSVALAQEDSTTIKVWRYQNINESATTTYDWTLTENEPVPAHLEFTTPFTDVKTARFLITAEKIEPTDNIPASFSGQVILRKDGNRVEYLDSIVGWLWVRTSPTESLLVQRVKYYAPVPPESFPATQGWYERTKDISISFSIPYAYRTNDYIFHDRTYYYYIHPQQGRQDFSHAGANPYPFTWTNNYVNDELAVTKVFNVPVGFLWDSDYPDGGWTTTSSTTFDVEFEISIDQTNFPPYGGHKVTNTAYGVSDELNLSDYAELFIDVIPPPPSSEPWTGITYSPGYWKNHQSATTALLPVTLCGYVVDTWAKALAILSNPSAKNDNGWNSFRCHFLTTLLNVANDPDLNGAYYNNTNITGEWMENQTVASIKALANTYTSTMSKATILQMKDVFDDINNNQSTHVLWTGPMSLKTFSLPTANSIALYPNLFSDKTEIRFGTEMKEPLKVCVYDLTGKKVRDLTGTGTSLIWDGTDNNGRKLTRGIYIIRANNVTVKALISR